MLLLVGVIGTVLPKEDDKEEHSMVLLVGLGVVSVHVAGRL